MKQRRDTVILVAAAFRNHVDDGAGCWNRGS
jgi:hypothetical protein